MAEDATLVQQAKANETVSQFAQGDYKKALTTAVVSALDSHTAMADQALKDERVFSGLADLLLEEVYRRLRDKEVA